MPETLSSKQIECADLMASGATAGDAARAVGVHRVTVQRWRREPAFRAAVEGARAGRLSAGAAALVAAVPRAVAALVGIVSDQNAPPAARVGAAREILDRAGLRLPEFVEPTATGSHDFSRLTPAELETYGNLLAKSRGETVAEATETDEGDL